MLFTPLSKKTFHHRMFHWCHQISTASWFHIHLIWARFDVCVFFTPGSDPYCHLGKDSIWGEDLGRVLCTLLGGDRLRLLVPSSVQKWLHHLVLRCNKVCFVSFWTGLANSHGWVNRPIKVFSHFILSLRTRFFRSENEHSKDWVSGKRCK